MSEESLILNSYILPGLPHLLLTPDKNPGWQKLNQAMKNVGKEIQNSGAEILILYSTYWPSIIGHQIQARENAEWILVDDQFHELGSIPYKLKFDSKFAEIYKKECEKRKLQARTIDYEGFPIDTGSVTVLKLINPDNKIPCVIVSSNIYSDRAETVILGKATLDAIRASGKKAVLVAITSLSNRLATKRVDPKDDEISSLKDHEWNLKFLEFLNEGRLEDAAQLSRQFHVEARVPKVSNFKPFWWLSAVNGQHNSFNGQVYEYAPVCGTGAAVVGLEPCPGKARDLEFDEDDPDTYAGDRPVL
ncbi:MAG: hypothetical protein KDD38_05525 [Bdellovibrionales bacterium]|nr:hypothetical protein [Bdellovibrionales bacterium]